MNAINLRQFETIRTTITLPADLVERSQYFVENGTIPSRNALIISALEAFLEELEQKEIDLQFAAMADDESYLALNKEIAKEFGNRSVGM
jgi:metal-responsive CopG/Arc/MetJ family transcriptional regulator